MTEISPYKLASVLLQYPAESLFAGVDQLGAAAAATSPRATKQAFGRFLDWLATTPPHQVAQHYVETFDLRRQCTLYLTYHRYGDTRQRGMAILTFVAAYRAAGLLPCTNELPDYLPVVLDFAAAHPRGEALLRAHRADLELIHRGLTKADTPYVHVVDAVRACLPKLTRHDLSIIERIEADPPFEQVGLEPFAPPEYVTGTGRESAR
jgi:nitrate reductase delta subunit